MAALERIVEGRSALDYELFHSIPLNVFGDDLSNNVIEYIPAALTRDIAGPSTSSWDSMVQSQITRSETISVLILESNNLTTVDVNGLLISPGDDEIVLPSKGSASV